MAAPLRLKFSIAFAKDSILIAFEHPLHGLVRAAVEHANGQLTHAAVILGGENAPLQALGARYADAVLDMAQWALARDAA